VTDALEQHLRLSLITLVFRDGTDDYWVRQRVTERIAQVTLPAGVQPGLDPVAGPGGEIYRYTLESDTKNLMELSEIQRWIVIPALKSGARRGRRQQLRRLHQGVPARARSRAAASTTASASRRHQRHQQQQYQRRRRPHRARRAELRDARRRADPHADDLGSIVVTQVNGGVPVLVRDLGKLQLGHQEREGILGKDNNPDTIEGIVLMLKYENPSRRARRRARQGRRAATRLGPHGREDRALHRPRRPGASDGRARSATPCSKASAWSASC
jgi:cobalt-zinc-cadmium resistance protein CzcA